ncbi:MAG: gliding motility-associated C-terminal domain-containing protein [Chitinophagaceae bacterium]|nr:gliding motility-associated C-terminal domain-containing protein [Chitinophagaceae bacterium]
MKKYLLCLFFIVKSFPINAQQISVLKRFSVDYSVGCYPLTVHITPHSSSSVLQYVYESGSITIGPITNKKSYTYLVPGKYKILQIEQTSTNPIVDSIIISVHKPTTPQVKPVLCKDFFMSVYIEDTLYDFYRVYYTKTDSVDVRGSHFAAPYNFQYASQLNIRVKGMYAGGNNVCGDTTFIFNTLNSFFSPQIKNAEVVNTGIHDSLIVHTSINPFIFHEIQIQYRNTSFQTIPSKQIQSIFIISNIDSKTEYCLRIRAYDYCEDSFYLSNTVCIPQVQVSFLNKKNEITFPTPQKKITSLQLLRNDSLLITSFDVNANSIYSDSLISCNTAYCYRVKFVYPDSAYSLSKKTCGISQKIQKLPPIKKLYSSFGTDGLALQWDKIESRNPITYHILVDKSDGIFTLFKKTFQNTEVLREFLNSRQSLRFSIQYSDNCDNISPPSSANAPVILTGIKTATNKYLIYWNNYYQFDEGEKMKTLEFLDEKLQIIKAEPLFNENTRTLKIDPDLQNLTSIRIRTESNGNIADTTYSNYFSLVYETEVFIPHAFTPNDDGLNDYFLVVFPTMKDFEMTIFNRWGNIVFHSRQQEVGWGGTFLQQPAPPGVYICIVKGKTQKNEIIEQRSNFLLLRD